MKQPQARQPCLQKPLPSAKFSATTARAKGASPLTPGAARLLRRHFARDQPVAGRGRCPLEITEKERMARPVKSEEEKLNHTVAFRLTDGDFLRYQRKFSASGFKQSEFFREHVLCNTTQVVARPVASVDAKRAVFLLQKASNNVNQLAHRANSEYLTGQVSEHTYVAILDQLQQLNNFMLEQAREVKK